MTAPLARTANPQDLDPQVVRLLPYAFAKAKGVLAARDAGGALEVWIRPYPQASTLAEVRRMAGRPLREVLLTPEEFDHCLALAYTREPSAAETIVEDFGDSVDLAKLTEQLPEVADLLETENEAPIIRLINAQLKQRQPRWLGASPINITRALRPSTWRRPRWSSRTCGRRLRKLRPLRRKAFRHRRGRSAPALPIRYRRPIIPKHCPPSSAPCR